MFDADLAIRVMNKLGRELVAALSASDPEETQKQIQKALNDHGLLYDVLHLGPGWDDIPHTLQVINISNPTK